MELLRFQVGIAPQHLPVFMASDQRGLLDPETRFKKTTRPFVPKIMEVEVFNSERVAGAVEGGADRAALVRKNPAGISIRRLSLLHKEFPGVEAANTEQRDGLVVPDLLPRVFAIAN